MDRVIMKTFGKILLGIFALLVAAFLILRVPQTDPAEMRAKYGGPPSQFIEMADGQTVHVRDEGPRDAPVIILLHGSNADLHTWQEWADRLKADYRVVRFDQIGHGLTGPAVSGTYALEDFGRTIDQVAEKLEIDRFVLAGNSMGGAIAMAYAIDHPERLTGLALVDAGGADIQQEGKGNLAFTIARIPVLGSLMSQLLPRSLVERSLSQSVYNQDVVKAETVDRYWELARYPGNGEATLKRFSTPRKSFAESDIRAMRVPTLVMWGEEDALIPVEAASWYADRLPDATRVTYPLIGHIPMEEAPERSVADLRIFLEGLAVAEAAAPKP